MWQKKDQLRVLSLITKLNSNVKFNDLAAKDIVELYADFAWLDEIKNKIEKDLREQQKAEQAAKALQAVEEIQESEDISEEAPKPKKKTRRKKRK